MALPASSTACDPIVIKGSKLFFKTNGTQFFARGVFYNLDTDYNDQQGSDAFYDTSFCTDSIPYMKDAGINLISIDSINLAFDQTSCMDAFAAAGIYVLVYLSSDLPIDVYGLWTTDSYTSFTAIIDFYAQWSNTLGFVMRRNNINSERTYIDAFMKAAARDVKAYLVAQQYRLIPVGYDVLYTDINAPVYPLAAQYMSCGNSTERLIDFQAIDLYETWCVPSAFENSGYQSVTEVFGDFPLPALISGYGCKKYRNSTRTFAEVDSIFGQNMSNVFSGGVAVSWEGTQDNGGLVDYSTGQVQLNPDYTTLSQKLATATPSSISYASYSPSETRVEDCPTLDATWQARADVLPPTPNRDLCTCMINSISCTVLPSIPLTTASALLPEICTMNSTFCRGTVANSTTGQYGFYSQCNLAQQTSWELNLYDEAQLALGNTSACLNVTTYARNSVPSPLTSLCMVYLDNDAGPLGDGVLSQSSPGSSDSSASPGLPSLLPGYPYAPISSGSRLSAGAIAGISIGGALLLLVGSGLFWWRRRRYIKYKRAAISSADMAGLQVQELHIHTERKAELGAGERRFEMETNRNTIEMPDLYSSPNREEESIYEAPDSSVSPVSPDPSNPGRNHPDGFQHLTHQRGNPGNG